MGWKSDIASYDYTDHQLAFAPDLSRTKQIHSNWHFVKGRAANNPAEKPVLQRSDNVHGVRGRQN